MLGVPCLTNEHVVLSAADLKMPVMYVACCICSCQNLSNSPKIYGSVADFSEMLDIATSFSQSV